MPPPRRIKAAPYAAQFRAAFGDQIFADREAAFDRALLALQKYQQEDTAEFAPYSSKYDAFLAGRTTLSPQEQRGLALFNDLPPEFAAKVNTTEVPYNRHAGDLPALDETDIQDVLAFLETLTDGFQP